MTPIAAAVMPLKDAAIERAGKEAEQLIARYHAKLAEHDWDARAAFPYPNGNMRRDQYLTMKSRHNLAQQLTKQDAARPYNYRFDSPMYRVRHEPAEVAFIESAKAQAGLQYDAFVAKLEGKIGACEAATISGNHVWGKSILTVTKADGSVERWMTQMIVNQSALGTLFNQWPTRKIK